ncbi:alpha/beta fold hydrolase [Hymenobacter elongatus]|uniref:Alpha/beta fold hydrolase n=1 Tax=Hymenobacter elongatus TaxID=877208 RepID=A0A4Z0PGW7_9BACT|nr:alpha/beta fold hydrolase [Hymenobacter elongatus]TGE12610.1 alpha/beta fold hydrolase [Hymenobacter elongatus]
MNMHYIRRGTGRPLLLLHGLGGSWRSWSPIFETLAAERDVIAVDLPGFGNTPPLSGDVSIRTLADAVTSFLRQHDLLGIDAVGSSMGARLVLELARRGGVVGAVVSLDPGGFWRGWEIPFFYASVAGSIRLIRALQPALPTLTRSPVSRTLLFAQFSARPWRIAPQVALDELRSFAAAPSFDELLYTLAYGERQQGAPAGSITEPLVIAWGRQDRVCLPRQAPRAVALFPGAHLHWFDACGHFPQWDAPQSTVRLILQVTGREQLPGASSEVTARSGVSNKVLIAAALAVVAGVAWLVSARRK